MDEQTWNAMDAVSRCEYVRSRVDLFISEDPAPMPYWEAMALIRRWQAMDRLVAGRMVQP